MPICLHAYMPIPLYAKKNCTTCGAVPTFAALSPQKEFENHAQMVVVDPRRHWIAQHCCLLPLATTKHTRFCCSAELVNSLSWIKSAPARRRTLTTTQERMYASERNSPIVNVRSSALSSNSCLEKPI